MTNKKTIKIIIVVIGTILLVLFPSIFNWHNSNRLNSVINNLSAVNIYPGEDVVFEKEPIHCYEAGSAKNFGPQPKTCMINFNVSSSSTKDDTSSITEIRSMYDRLTDDNWHPRKGSSSGFSEDYQHQLVPNAYHYEMNKNYGSIKCDLWGEYGTEKKNYTFEGRCHYESMIFGFNF